MSRVYVVDTGYLLELFLVPGHSSTVGNKEVMRRFGEAYHVSAHLYVPAQCIYELANLIAHVKSGGKRRMLARKVDSVLQRCFRGDATERPWNIVPSPDGTALPEHWQAFVDKYATQAIGLTDAGVLIEATRLKERYRMGPDFPVHIWTTAQDLKSREPDAEQNAFVG